jgi:hypothetical protein
MPSSSARSFVIAFVIGALILPSFARSHTLGLSTADFTVQPDGRVQARFVFASSEPLGALWLDRDHDGVVTAEDVAAARGDLGRFILDGVDFTADGDRCPATFEAASLSEIDGLVLTARYACPDDADSVEATLYYLSALPRGHREIGRIVAASATTEAVMTADRRAVQLTLPHSVRTSGRRRVPRSWFAGGLVAAATAWFARGVWQRRRAKTHKGHALNHESGT